MIKDIWCSNIIPTFHQKNWVTWDNMDFLFVDLHAYFGKPYPSVLSCNLIFEKFSLGFSQIYVSGDMNTNKLKYASQHEKFLH